MKKAKWMGILLSGVMSAAALSAPIVGMADDWVAVDYPNYTVRGDINSDGTFEVLDLVRMQRYLHGQYGMTRQGTYNADINDDGVVDVFDLAYMKRRLLLGEPGYTVRVDHLSYQEGFYTKSMTDPNVVIQNTTGLKRYLEPIIETLTTGTQFKIPVVDEEDLEGYLALYNNEFFKENVLCLHPISQRCGSELMYQVTDFAMNDGTLEIHYTDTYDPYMSYPDVETSVLAQVAIPKELFLRIKDVKWVYAKQAQEAFTPDITSDYTANVTDTAWSEALCGNGTAVIRTAEELDTWASVRFQDAVVRSLKKTYDAAYFAENVLIVDLYAQRQRGLENALAEVMKVSRTGNSIVLTYDDQSTNDVVVGRPYTGIVFTQVTIPAAQYHDETVSREFTWQTPV
ncbi:MAG: dockerin type I repeat-containing protein, partial [Oscillospiraceae bacterium]|nr:dockerin type I repeat-containing protein [Oscillospiraceae bacterium]